MNNLIKAFVFILMLSFFSSCNAQSKKLNINNQVSVNTEIEKVKKRTPVNSGEILAGIGVLEAQLGDSREIILSFIGQPSEDYTFNKQYASQCFVGIKMHWVEPDKDNDGNLDFNGDGIFLYLRENIVSQIYISTPRYATANSITFGNTEKQLLEKYKGFGSLQKFVLTKSAEKYNGGQDLYYYVDTINGIAFELSYDKRINQRSIWAILVFSSNTEFIPKECIMETQKLEPIS